MIERRSFLYLAAAAPVLGTTSVRADTPAPGGFRFTQSVFDDGWIADVRPKWVEVARGGIKVLLHYPVDVKAANTDPDVMASAAWNTIVAPRYSTLRNYATLDKVLNYERPYLAQGDLIDNATGKPCFAAVFSQGNSGWIEIVSPSRAAFTAAFGVDVAKINANRWGNSADSLNALRRLATYNKFAVAATDFVGRWTTNFSANTFYVNLVTGNSAGMSSYSSSQEFEFFPGQTYKWKIAAANSFAGKTDFAHGKGEGRFEVPDNWHIHFSNMEGKPRTSDAQFQATHGGRILIIDGTAFVRAG